MRYRLIPTRRRRELSLVHFEADARHQAENVAGAQAEEWGVRALLCEAPLGGLVRALGTHGEEPESKPVRRAKR
jgi:hypothetical protein